MKLTPRLIQRLPASLLTAFALLLLGGVRANAQFVTLDFDGLQNLETVGQYYDGGRGGSGSGPGNVLVTAALPGRNGSPLYNASSNLPVVLGFGGTARSVRFVLPGGAAT